MVKASSRPRRHLPSDTGNWPVVTTGETEGEGQYRGRSEEEPIISHKISCQDMLDMGKSPCFMVTVDGVRHLKFVITVLHTCNI